MKYRNSYKNTFIALLVVAGAVASAMNAVRASSLPPNYTSTPLGRYGFVLVRGLELGDSGKPIWTEIYPDGSFGATIGEAVDEYGDARPMAASAYRSYKQLLDNFRSNNPALTRGAYILNREEYQARENFGTVDVAISAPQPGGPQTEAVPIQKGNELARLPDAIKSVLIRAAETIPDPRLLPDDTGPVLLQFPVDMRPGVYQDLPDGTKSVLLGDTGEVLFTSAENIGFKSGYFHSDDPDEEGPPLGPVVGAKVEAGVYTYRDRHAVTDESGRFGYEVLKPGCPGFQYTQSFVHRAHLMNRNFDPNAPDFLDFSSGKVPDHFVCSGLSALLGPGPFGFEGSIKNSLLSSELGTFSGDVTRSNAGPIYIDIVQFTGQAKLSNDGEEMIPVGDATEYEYDAPGFAETATPYLDLDADRQQDFVVLDGDTQSVYLDGAGTAQGQVIDADGNVIDEADLERRADTQPDFEDQGLLSQISEEDLKKTDIYVFRQSNGQMAIKHHELDEGFIDHVDDWHFWYRLRVPGQRFSDTCLGGGVCVQGVAESRAAWQEAQGVAEDLREFESDHLRPGELVKIIAINRPTGYVGTVVTTINPPQDGVRDEAVEEIVLEPPNLRITAERIYTPPSGLSANEEQQHTIGFEGSALTSDTLISIRTEWFDRDGTPLPSALEGYTGRMAKVTGPNSLEGGDVATFSIQPGSHLQVVKFEGDILGSEHFYVHVSGFPEWENPGTGAASQGPLQHRPKNYVPIQVPIFDEAATRQARNANNYNRNAGEDGVEEVPVVYRFPHRPEMQFSVFELDQQALQLSYEDEEGESQVIDLSRADPEEVSDIFFGETTLVDLLYSLVAPEVGDPLEPLGPDRELIFALGEDEVPVTFDENGQVEFSHLEHLSRLAVDDYLTLRLFQNSDSANVLWEYAFAPALQGAPLEGFVSADDPQLDLVAYLPVGEINSDAPAKNVTVRWRVDGPGGSLEHSVSESSIGLFTNTLITQREADQEYTVTARITDSEDERFAIGEELEFGPFKVVPGEPASIEMEGDADSMQANEVGEIELSAVVYDGHENRVADGTPVTWQLDYDGELQSPVAETADGVASVNYEVGDKLLASSVIVQAGTAEQQFPINKTPVTAALNLGAASVPADGTTTVALSVSSNAEDDTPVEWNTTHGRIINAQNAISGGQATATLVASNIPGDGTVMVSVADAVDDEVIEYTGAGSGLSARFEHAAIVAEDGPGSVTVDTLNGTAQHSYITSTNVTLTGAANQELDLSVGGFFTPNAPPSLHYAMDGIVEESPGTASEQRYIADLISGVRANIMGDVEDDRQNGFTDPGSSLAMNGGHLIVDAVPELHIPDDLFVNVRFRTNSTDSNQQLVFKGDGTTTAYKLSLINGGSTLQATITTDQGSYSVESDTLIQQDTWYIAGLRVRNGRLELGLNDERQAVDIAGQIVGENLDLAFGSGLEGNLDDIKIGRETAANAFLAFGDGSLQQTVTLGADGSITLPVRATGNAVSGTGQVVGLTARATGLTSSEYAPEQAVNFGQMAMETLSTLMGMSVAYAQPAAGAQENGLGLASAPSWGYVAEWVGKRVFGDAFDTVKRVAHFVFELTAINDIYVLAKAMISLVRTGNIGDTDAFEITFATIGIGITVLTVFTGGAAAPLKLGLTAIKPVLRELFRTGLQDAIKVGILAGKFLFRQIKAFVSDPGRAIREMGDMVVAFKDIVLDTSGAALRVFFRSVRSLDDLRHWIKSFKLDDSICLVANAQTARYPALAFSGEHYGHKLSMSLLAGAGDLFMEVVFGEVAHAQGCGKVTAKLKEITLNVGRYGDNAADIGRQVRKVANILNDAGIALSSSRSYDVLGDIASRDGGLEVIEAFARNASRNFENSSVYTLRLTGEAADRLLGSIGDIPVTSANYEKWVKALSDNNSFAIKGVFGESEAIARTISKYGANPDTLVLADRVDHSFVNVHGQTVRPNAQGVDAAMDLSDGRKLFVEAKVRSSATNVPRGKVLSDLKVQFFKHIETKIKPLVVAGEDGVEFAGDLVPVLDYQLFGSFYQGVSKTEVVELFHDALKDPRLRQVVEAGFEFDESHVDIAAELIRPFIN